MLKGRYSTEQYKLQLLLTECRKSAGFTQDELAEKLNVHQSFISKYEAGERILSLLEVRHICVALDVSLQDFIKRLEMYIQYESRYKVSKPT